MVSLSISSQAFSKDRTSSFVYIFSSQTSITCFGIPPWSHGIWFVTDKNPRSQNKQTQLSLSPEISQRKWEPSPKGGMVKTSTPQGCPLFFHWLTDFPSRATQFLPKGASPPKSNNGCLYVDCLYLFGRFFTIFWKLTSSVFPSAFVQAHTLYKSPDLVGTRFFETRDLQTLALDQ